MGRRPVVLLVSETFDIYGAERWAAAVASGLARHGIDVVLARPRPAEGGLALDPAVRLAAFEVFDLDDPNAWIADRSLAADLIERFAPDAALVSCGNVLANLGVREELVERRVPFASVHHLGGEEGFDLPCPPALAPRVAAVLAQAVEVVGVSADVVASLRRHYGLDADRGSVIANGRPAAYFAPTEAAARRSKRRELGVADDEVLVLTTARVHPAKGYQYQLEALDLLRHRPVWGQLRFAWAGGTEALRRLRALVLARGLGDRVALLGARHDVPELLGAADLFVLPSKQEGTPLALIEAMAKGLPVITTPVNGIPDLVGDTAVLLTDPNLDPSATASDLADAVERLALDPAAREQLGRAAHERSLAGWHEDAMVAAYGALADRMLAS